MLTGIGAPTSWPFFQRHGSGPSRTPLGTALGASVTTVTIVGVNLAIGDLLLVGTVSDNCFSANTVEAYIDATLMTQDIVQANALTTMLVSMNSLAIPAAIIGGTITASWAIADDPDNMAIVACKVSGLVGVLEEPRSATFNSTSVPDCGLTAVYAASGFHWGIVGTKGRSLDLLGAWQNSMVAGQRVSSAFIAVDLKEGYRIPATPVAARTRIIGQTSRPSTAQVGYYS
jgi:hypothetical protein